MTDGQQNIFIGTHNGYAVSFSETAVRSMGRTAAGVRGIRLREGDYVVGSDLLIPGQEILVISEKGYGKRTAVSDYPIKGRGGKGIKTANITEKNGPLAGIAAVTGEEDILLITDTGVLIRFKVANVSQTGRATLGVRLIRVDDEAKVATMAKVEAEPDEPETQNATTEPTVPTENVTDTGLAQVDDLLARAEENQNEPNND